MLQEGTHAPTFTLPGTTPEQDASETQSFSLEDALETGAVLLNFYLFDFHPACTENLCELHDLSWFALSEALTVFGISTDRTFSHRAFAEQEDLGYTLLSDSDGSVSAAYDVLHEEFDGHKRIAKRSVFLIGTEGTIRYAWAADTPSQQPPWDDIKAAVERLPVPY